MPALVSLLYYLLGGVTFLPLCLVATFIYFSLFAPLADETERIAAAHHLHDASDGTTDISPEKKAAALDLALRNAKAQGKFEESGQSVITGNSLTTSARSAAIPGAPKRLGTSAAHPRPHRSGWLVLRKQFDPIPPVSKGGQGHGQLSKDGNNHTHASLQSLPLDKASDLGRPDATPLAATTPAAATTQPASSSTHMTSPSRSKSSSSKPGYMSAMYRGLMDYRTTRADNRKANAAAHSTTTFTDQPSAASSRDDASPTPTAASTPPLAAPKDAYFCILKSPTLYIYSSQDVTNSTTECLAAIDLRGKRISLYINGIGDVEGEPDGKFSPGTGDSHDTASSEDEKPRTHFSAKAVSLATTLRRIGTRDGDLFQKRNAIRIVSTSSSPLHPLQQWFVFLRSSTILEDWYHAIVHASLAPSDSIASAVDPIGPVFDFEDMQGLLSSLDSLPDPIPLRWLNAMVGRVFYSIYRTAWIEEYVTRKVMKKISRVRTPTFLSDIRVKEVHLGNTPPAFSRPMLKSLTGEGEASMEVAMHYRGGLRLTISTVLTISLGSRFKPYHVPLVLAVVITSLEGNLLLQIKPPPSNRIWYGFTSLPKMQIDVEPVVSERKVQWSMVKRLIESRIKDLMMESMVVPNMDDIAFYDTRPNARRGGIWAEAAVKRADGTLATGATQSVSKAKDEAAQSTNYVKDESATAVTTATEKFKLAEENLRNRKKPAQDDAAVPEKIDASLISSSSTQQSPASSSPAMAGLSALLARNNAQGVHANSSAASLPQSASPTETISSSMSSARSLDRARAPWFKTQKPQSSLAWGSASVVAPSEGGSSTPLPTLALHDDEEPDDITPRIPYSSSTASLTRHAHNRRSISSTSSVATDDLHAAMARGVDSDDEDGDRQQRVSRDKEEIAVPDRGSTATPQAIGLSSLRARDPDESDDTTPVPQELFSREELSANETARESHYPILSVRSGSANSSLNSSRSEMDLIPILPPRKASAGPVSLLDAGNALTESKVDNAMIRTPLDPMAPAPPPRSSQAYGPPPRRPTVASRQPSQHKSLSRAVSRESLGSETSSLRSPSTQQATALWNQAKSRMADKESRQATAVHAKDALKRGWASWSSKRAVSNASSVSLQQQQQQQAQQAAQVAGVKEEWNRLERAAAGRDSMPSRADETASRSSTCSAESSTWTLGTSATDPVSLGAGFGFEMSPHGSPEWQRSDGSDRTASHLSPTQDGSSVSSISSNAAYRDYRAGRSRENSRASSPRRSSQSTSNPSSTDTEAGFRASSSASIRKTSLGTSSTLSSDPPAKDGFAFLPPAAQPLTGLVNDKLPTSMDVTPTTPVKPASMSIASTTDNAPRSDADGLQSDAATPRQSGESRNDEHTPRNASTAAAAMSRASSTSRDKSRSSATSHLASPSSTRIRSQPGQMTMMSVPGMQRKSGEPTSFSAPPPPATIPTPQDEGGAKSSVRATGSRLSFTGLKLPTVFGGGSGDGSSTMPSTSSSLSPDGCETALTAVASSASTKPPSAESNANLPEVMNREDCNSRTSAERSSSAKKEGPTADASSVNSSLVVVTPPESTFTMRAAEDDEMQVSGSTLSRGGTEEGELSEGGARVGDSVTDHQGP